MTGDAPREDERLDRAEAEVSRREHQRRAAFGVSRVDWQLGRALGAEPAHGRGGATRRGVVQQRTPPEHLPERRAERQQSLDHPKVVVGCREEER